MLLLALLYIQVLHVVNQLHFKMIVTGIPGVAPANLLFLAILFLMRGKEDVLKDEQPILKNAILAFYGALTFAFLWALVRAPGDFMDDLTYWKNALFYPLVYFVFFKCRQDEKNTRRLIYWVLLVAAVAGLEGLREGLSYGFGNFNPFKRASGPFGDDWHHANRAGVFYGMFMPMFVAIALFLKGQKLIRLSALGAILVTAGGALATYSRQAYFLILLAFVVLLVRRSIVLLIVIGIASASLVSYLPDSVFQRVEETKQQDKSGNEEVDQSTASRWEIWSGVVPMLASNPIGVGLNRWKGEIGNFSSYKRIDAHNFYVLTLGECGPVGLITLLYLIATLFKLASWVRNNRPPDDSECTALTIGFTVCTLNMALGGIYGSPTLEGSVMAPYWALCGLMERYIHLKKLNNNVQEKTEEAPRDSLVDRFPLAAFGARRSK